MTSTSLVPTHDRRTVKFISEPAHVKRMRNAAPAFLRETPRLAGTVATMRGTFASDAGLCTIETLYAPFVNTCGSPNVVDQYACVVGAWHGVEEEHIFEFFDGVTTWTRECLTMLLTSNDGQRVTAAALSTSNKVVQTLATALLAAHDKQTVSVSHLIDGTLSFQKEVNAAARTSARERAPHLLRLLLALVGNETISLLRVSRFIEVCAAFETLGTTLALDVACNMDVLERDERARLFVARAAASFIASAGVSLILQEVTSDLDVDFWALVSGVEGATVRDMIDADRTIPRLADDLGDFESQAQRRFHVFNFATTLKIELSEAIDVSRNFTCVAQFTRNAPALVAAAVEAAVEAAAVKPKRGRAPVTKSAVLASVNADMDNISCTKCGTMQCCDAVDCATQATPCGTGASAPTFVCSTFAGHFCKKCNITWTQKRKAVSTKGGNSVLALWMEGLAFTIETTSGVKLSVDATAPYADGLVDVTGKNVCSASVKIVRLVDKSGTTRAVMRYGTFSSRREVPVKLDTCRVSLETAEQSLQGCEFTVVDAGGKTQVGNATNHALVYSGLSSKALVKSSSVCIKRVVRPDAEAYTGIPALRLGMGERVAVRTTLVYGSLHSTRDEPIQSFHITKAASKSHASSAKPTTATSDKSATLAKSAAATKTTVATQAANVAHIEDPMDSNSELDESNLPERPCGVFVDPQSDEEEEWVP